MSKYYRKPAVEIQRPSDSTFAFTMRLLNFLSTLHVGIWKDTWQINPIVIDQYAERMHERSIDR